MGYRGYGAYGQWGTWVMGYIGIIMARSRCENLRLPYIFLISEGNS